MLKAFHPIWVVYSLKSEATENVMRFARKHHSRLIPLGKKVQFLYFVEWIECFVTLLSQLIHHFGLISHMVRGFNRRWIDFILFEHFSTFVEWKLVQISVFFSHMKEINLVEIVLVVDLCLKISDKQMKTYFNYTKNTMDANNTNSFSLQMKFSLKYVGTGARVFPSFCCIYHFCEVISDGFFFHFSTFSNIFLEYLTFEVTLSWLWFALFPCVMYGLQINICCIFSGLSLLFELQIFNVRRTCTNGVLN